MNYKLIKDVLDLVSEFEVKNTISNKSEISIEDFKDWIFQDHSDNQKTEEPNWEGKENGRSSESIINTLILHLNRYAKSYSKSAIYNSEFSSQEDFIYLINLKAFGQMSKMDLIKKNVHEKPVGIKIINRLISKGWVDQEESIIDKRSKVLKINNLGNAVLDKQMDKIRKASLIVTGDLSKKEKMNLIRLLNKLNNFHRPFYDKNLESKHLLNEVLKNIN